MKISVVCPVYKAEKCVDELVGRLVNELPKISKDFEIILINDASPDGSWDKIKNIASREKRIRAIKFSRNFGQHVAISAGLDYARGDYVVVMDCDLQDRPEDIIRLYRELQSGFDVVWGRRAKRKDNLLRRALSRVFYFVYNRLTDSLADSKVANFSISRQIVISNFRRFNEHSRSFPLFIEWMGFKTSVMNVDHSKRFEGKSSYNLSKMLSLSIDSIVSQSNKPLLLFVELGSLLAAVAFIYACYLVVRRVFFLVSVEGWTSLMVSLFFIGGLILANLGILGLYIGKIFNEVKNRPLYIVEEAIRVKNFRR